MTDARTWLDQVDAHDDLAIVAAYATTALRAVLDLHAFVPVRPGIHSHKCRACQTPYPCPTVAAVTTALEDA